MPSEATRYHRCTSQAGRAPRWLGAAQAGPRDTEHAMSSHTASQSPRAVLRLPEFQALMGARLTNAVAASALATVVGFQVYQLTHDPLSLGLLGLVEAIPALSLSIIGGHVADRHDRRSIVLATSATLVVLVALLAVISNGIAVEGQQLGLLAILGVIFVSGIASGFERPAFTAFEAQVIPIEQVSVGTSIASSVWITGAIAGPALGGIAVAIVGLPATYAFLAVLLAISTGCIARIARKPMPVPEPGERIRDSLRVGIRFVFRSQVLWGSMALDLFAVLFGGVVALLPVFADILGVGPVGLGVMRTAPSAGALLSTLVATRLPPRARAGRTLLIAVAGFGVSILVFALSTSFILSLAALFVSGVTDGVSMVIRNVTVRIYSPEAMRGRISSVSWVFVGASNELGAFESGLLASLLGTVPSVLLGGIITLVVVGVVAVRAPLLRRLDLGITVLPQDERETIAEFTG